MKLKTHCLLSDVCLPRMTNTLPNLSLPPGIFSVFLTDTDVLFQPGTVLGLIRIATQASENDQLIPKIEVKFNLLSAYV